MGRLIKKYLTCIPREQKTFWQLSRLYDFAINAIASLFIHERLNIPESYSEPKDKTLKTKRLETFTQKTPS